MSRRILACHLILLLSTSVGCRGPWSAATNEPAILSSAPASTPAAPVAQPDVATQQDETTEEEALAAVLDELTEVGALDAEAKRLLIEDLRAAKPENWPLIVRQFRSALAFREQLAARERQSAEELMDKEPTTRLAVVEQSPHQRVEVATNAHPTVASVSADGRQVEAPEALPMQSTAVAHQETAPQIVTPDPPVILDEPPAQMAQQVSYVTKVTPPLDWQAHLQHAIANLEATVQPTPGSADEVNEHMRLRLLQLLAGQEESALLPIPGASAPQQDYWNKQLFAVSTYLDSRQQPDDKRRAAGSLMHLDQARAKLAELATLQVRNLTFVDSVEGYGAYELHAEKKFRPGDQVTLYAEIENFSSEATKEGHRTRLGTSYEVVDKNGQRVDSAQFPEIEDLCRNPRRDFHMQYTVTLPTRIYPEHYEIRLIITDQQSHKIGQASVAFEIVE